MCRSGGLGPICRLQLLSQTCRHSENSCVSKDMPMKIVLVAIPMMRTVVVIVPILRNEVIVIVMMIIAILVMVTMMPVI